MIALIIIAAVVILLLLLLNIPAYAHIRFYNGKPDISVKYLCLTLFPRQKSPQKREKKAKPKDIGGKETAPSPKKPPPAQKTGGSGEQEEKKPFLQALSDKLDELVEKKDAVLLLWELCGGHIARLLKKIRIDDILIDFAAADVDASAAAVAYGRLCAAVYNAIGVIGSRVSISVRSVDIDCLFDTPSERSRYDGECRIKLRPASLVNAVAAIAAGYAADTEKYSPVLKLFDKSKNKK